MKIVLRFSRKFEINRLPRTWLVAKSFICFGTMKFVPKTHLLYLLNGSNAIFSMKNSSRFSRKFKFNRLLRTWLVAKSFICFGTMKCVPKTHLFYRLNGCDAIFSMKNSFRFSHKFKINRLPRTWLVATALFGLLLCRRCR
jgi:hypothetical protein